MADSFENYLRAINNPSSKLRRTFDDELKFLRKNVKKDCLVLELGCGVGRPTIELSKELGKCVGIDNDKRRIDMAEKNAKKAGVGNIDFIQRDAVETGFKDECFGMTYATYNLLGMVKESDREKLINEMARVTKKGGKVINITWKDDKETTGFLRKYYPSIGLDIINIDDSKTLTSKGEFRRFTKEQLKKYYTDAGLKKIEFFDIGEVWMTIVGVK